MRREIMMVSNVRALS